MVLKNLLLLALAGVSLAQDQLYCGPDYTTKNICPLGNQVCCLSYFNSLSVNCPSDAEVLDLTDLKDHITAILNGYRQTIANGDMFGFPRAAHMPTLAWDDLLASFADCHVRSCTFAHSKCRKSPQFRYAGENLSTAQGYENATVTIEEFLQGWWDEYQVATVSDIRVAGQTTATTGHFTAICQDKTAKFGCAALTHSSDRLYFVCIFGYTNMKGAPVYIETSNYAGSDCVTGTNPDYPALCSEDEVVNPVP